MDARESSEPEPGRASAWASLALLSAALLVLLRGAALYAMDRQWRGHPLDTTLAHVADVMPRTALAALVAGAAGAGIALKLAHGAGAAAFARAFLASALAALAALAVLSGFGVDDPYHVPHPGTIHGRAGLMRLALFALLAGLAIVATARRANTRVETRLRLARPRVRALSAAAALLAPLAFVLVSSRLPPMRETRQAVREILFETPSWTLVESRPDDPPSIGMLTPSLDWRFDGEDLPALVMPPPCEVRFVVGANDGPVRLRASAGVDQSAWSAPDERTRGHAVVFQVRVNGDVRFGAEIQLEGGRERRAWRHAGGAKGLELEPGDEVSLRTSFNPPGDAASTPALRAGFGRLVLERATRRPRERAGKDAPNVVLVVMDTLRADRVSCIETDAPPTRNLDELGARGTVYTRARATASWTWPSTASILTGLEPQAHGVLDDDACWLAGSLDTLPEVLGRRGYTTAAFSCNPLIDEGKNFDQGFETFDASRDFRKSGVVLPAIAGWLAMHQEERFFLYLHLVDTHHPLTPRAEDFARAAGGAAGADIHRPADYPELGMMAYCPDLMRGRGHSANGEAHPELVIPPAHQAWLQREYDASVMTADHWVGEILARLRELGLEDKTIVAFTADHGEELLDHGLLGHGHTIDEELVRVPLILAGPGVARGARSDALVSNRHLFETLAHAAGATTSIADAVDLARPDAIAPQTVTYSTLNGWWNGPGPGLSILGIEEGGWALQYAPRGLPWGVTRNTEPGEGQVRLFDVAHDPHERVDVAAAHPDVVAALKEKVLARAREAEKLRPKRILGAGSSTLEMLREIGYVGTDEAAAPPKTRR